MKNVEEEQLDMKLLELKYGEEQMFHVLLSGLDPLKVNCINNQDQRSCFTSLREIFFFEQRRLTYEDLSKEKMNLVKFILGYNFKRIALILTSLLASYTLGPQNIVGLQAVILFVCYKLIGLNFRIFK